MKVKVIKKPVSRHHRGVTPIRRQGMDLRCHCNRLLARAVQQGIELRCPRCKHDTVLSWARLEALGSDWIEVQAAE